MFSQTVPDSPDHHTDTVQSFRVLGVRVDAVQISQVIHLLEGWIRRPDRTRYVAVTGMHGIAEALHDAELRAILLAANLVVPDGMPLIWLARWNGHQLRRRVYGPELMDTFCRVTGGRYRHFFYGGAPGVSKSLGEMLSHKYGVVVAGTYSPPFRALGADEEKEILDLIHRSQADVLWVGLSTPKQERWMFHHRERLNVPVMLGVGAAFDLNLGRVRQAPRWMREHGLEWFFRLMIEPRRLWRRYLILGPQFAWNVSFELLGFKRYG
jgi:N-acetylglucosaminyldiphosphoundecaprenol N-acetyl-beta-D-mannosaminyltransferase